MNMLVICPTCQGTAKRMVVLSAICIDDYFHCTDCKTVSQTRKDMPGPALPFGGTIQRS